MKKGKTNYSIIVIVTILLLLAMMTLVGCAPKEKLASYTLQEAYDNGLIDLDDLKSIAYYQNNGKEWYYDDNELKLVSKDWDYEPQVKNPTELSEETKEDIKSTVAFHINQSAKSKLDKVKITDIEIVSYLGTYNGYRVVSTDCKVGAVIGVDIVSENVAGIELVYPPGISIDVWDTKK